MLDIADRKGQGAAQPFAEPPAAVRAALPDLDKALTRRDTLQGKQTALMGEVAQLQATLAIDRQRDRVAYAAAAEASEPAPPSIAEQTEKLIEEKRSFAIALVDKIDQQQEHASRTIIRHRDTWVKDVEQRISDHVGHYTAVIYELEPARQAVVDDINAKSWLKHYPEQAPMPQVHHMPQPPEFADQPKPTASHIFNYLRRDAEALPNTAGVVVDTRRALNLYNHGAGFEPVGGGRRWIR
jgi:hypothetical protein